MLRDPLSQTEAVEAEAEADIAVEVVDEGAMSPARPTTRAHSRLGTERKRTRDQERTTTAVNRERAKWPEAVFLVEVG